MNYNLLPKEIKDWIDSAEVEKMCNQVAAENSVNKDEGGLTILTNIVALITGSIDTASFTNEISSSLGVDDKTADKITAEIIDGILNKISSQLLFLGINIDKLIGPVSLDYSVEPENSPIVPIKPYFSKDESLEFIRTAKSPEPPIPSVNSTTLSPSPPLVTNQTKTSPPQEASISEPQRGAPFILHNEEEVEPTKKRSSQPVSERPIFYKPTFSEEYKKSVLEEKAARIELGEETEKKKQPESFKTPIKEARIVHYSEFRTPLGPFGNQEIREPNQTTPEKEPQSAQARTLEVHPNNVVDLKDLPLE